MHLVCPLEPFRCFSYEKGLQIKLVPLKKYSLHPVYGYLEISKLCYASLKYFA